MADVEVQMQITTERKVRKVKKTSKRRESQDGTYEEQVVVTESTSNDKENLPAITQPEDNAGYAPLPSIAAKQSLLDPVTFLTVERWRIKLHR